MKGTLKIALLIITLISITGCGTGNTSVLLGDVPFTMQGTVSPKKQHIVEAFFRKLATAGKIEIPYCRFRYVLGVDVPSVAVDLEAPSRLIMVEREIAEGEYLKDFKAAPLEISLFHIEASGPTDYWIKFGKQFPHARGKLRISQVRSVGKDKYHFWCTWISGPLGGFGYEFEAELRSGRWQFSTTGASSDI